MNKKSFLTLIFSILLSLNFVTSSFADAAIIYQPQQVTAYVKNYADIPSGRRADGFYYGLERLVGTRERVHGVPVSITSVVKLGENQYQVTCLSEKYVANGTFIVDIYREYDSEVREGYNLWFGLFDSNMKRYGTAQVKRKK